MAELDQCLRIGIQREVKEVVKSFLTMHYNSSRLHMLAKMVNKRQLICWGNKSWYNFFIYLLMQNNLLSVCHQRLEFYPKCTFANNQTKKPKNPKTTYLSASSALISLLMRHGQTHENGIALASRDSANCKTQDGSTSKDGLKAAEEFYLRFKERYCLNFCMF